MARHNVAAVRRESRLKVAIVSASALGMLVGIFLVARLVFGLIEDLGSDTLGGNLHLSDLVFSRLLGFFAAVLLGLLVFSNALIAYAAFFRSREMPPLLLAPLTVTEIFYGRFVECVVFSSWASAFLGAPALMAYGLAVEASWGFYFGAVAFFIPFVVIPAAVGAILCFLAVRVVLYLHRRASILLAALLVLSGAIGGILRGRWLESNLQEPEEWRRWLEVLEAARHPYLPSFWLAEGTLATATGRWTDALFYLLLLIANALFLAWLASLVAERHFFAAWSMLVSDDQAPPRVASQSAGGGSRASLERLLSLLPQPRQALWIKDLRLFWRDPAQWSQFLIFFGVMALYVLNAGGQKTLAGLGEKWLSLGVVLNVAACLLILASLTSRFVYPLVSLEGKRFWILGLAPLGIRFLVWQKFWLSLVTCGFFTLGLTLLTVWRLGLEPATAGLVLLAVGAATSALCGLAVGLGSLYANFREDNPARVVSGMGGTLNFLLSALFIVWATAILAGALVGQKLAAEMPDQLLWLHRLPALLLLSSAFFTTWLPMRMGIRHLERTDF